jgi:hypothetical protein
MIAVIEPHLVDSHMHANLDHSAIADVELHLVDSQHGSYGRRVIVLHVADIELHLVIHTSPIPQGSSALLPCCRYRAAPR